MYLYSTHAALDDELLDDDDESHQCNGHELSDGLILEDEALGETRAEQEGAVERVEGEDKLKDIEGWLYEVNLLILLENVVVYEAELS